MERGHRRDAATALSCAGNKAAICPVAAASSRTPFAGNTWSCCLPGRGGCLDSAGMKNSPAPRPYPCPSAGLNHPLPTRGGRVRPLLPSPLRRSAGAASMGQVLALLLFLIPVAGVRAETRLELDVSSEACLPATGGQIGFTVVAGNMRDVRLAQFEIQWTPEDAVAQVNAEPAGIALQHAFLSPSPPLVTGNRAEYGIATFGNSMSGDGAIVSFALQLGPSWTPDQPVDVYLTLASLGTSFADRDTIPVQPSVVLSGYCDDAGQPVLPGVFLHPASVILPSSPPDQAGIVNQSTGEAAFRARIVHGTAPVPEQRVTWEVRNTGTATVFAMQADLTLTIPPGQSRESVAYSDRHGAVPLWLDSPEDESGATGRAQLRVCADDTFAPQCAAAAATWHPPVTSVTADAALPAGPAWLDPPYPNPFNSTTTVVLHTRSAGDEPVTVTVHDILGRRVAVLASGLHPPGVYRLSWDGTHQHGQRVASGVYLCRLQQRHRTQVVPLLLVR